MLGFLLVDKPIGVSSHDAVNSARRALGESKVGHAGTLDPMATGLLVLAVGAATRLIQYLDLEPKRYEAEIVFGKQTTTLDAEGEITHVVGLPLGLRKRIEREVKLLTGPIQQVPPMHSAVKHGGARLYSLARRGKQVERAPRPVTVSEFRLLGLKGGAGRFHVACSSGTYVRSLASDLGRAVGCGAYLHGLRRTALGSFEIRTAKLPDVLSAGDLIDPAQALAHMPTLVVDAESEHKIRNGLPIQYEGPDKEVALKDERGALVAIARRRGNELWPARVIFEEAAN